MIRNILISAIFLLLVAQSPWAQDQEQNTTAAQADTLEGEYEEAAGELEEPPIDGEPLFKALCSACHHPTQRLVGPALKGVKERRDSAWIVNFIVSSQTMIEEGDSLANALFMEYNQVPMPDHPQLSIEQINAIIDYANAPEAGVAKDEQPIKRPEVERAGYTPLSFTSFTFWLIYTATVFMIIGWLYYMIEYTEIVKKATGNKDGDEGVPFGEQ